MKSISISELLDLVWKAAQSTELHYDYAERLKMQVEFYRHGMKQTIPDEWKNFIPEPTPEELAMESHSLQFEYCECGCHGHEGHSKGLSYWLYNDLGGPTKGPDKFHLYNGHGPYGPKIGVFNSFEKAVIAAQKDWDKRP